MIDLLIPILCAIGGAGVAGGLSFYFIRRPKPVVYTALPPQVGEKPKKLKLKYRFQVYSADGVLLLDSPEMIVAKRLRNKNPGAYLFADGINRG